MSGAAYYHLSYKQELKIDSMMSNFIYIKVHIIMFKFSVM